MPGMRSPNRADVTGLVCRNAAGRATVGAVPLVRELAQSRPGDVERVACVQPRSLTATPAAVATEPSAG